MLWSKLGGFFECSVCIKSVCGVLDLKFLDGVTKGSCDQTKKIITSKIQFNLSTLE